MYEPRPSHLALPPTEPMHVVVPRVGDEPEIGWYSARMRAVSLRLARDYGRQR